ncbi:DUF2461 domain-containing protein [uncultured Sulfitobacter sp.]|uniref:DUF2461 domain-containing protein n=1 Tax=uncultured Sulfitobacter sp. TaxID=191468 RepID=UPI002637CD61|nr:DUF2461 domain-containing protein [uncultured Sulfitobacter sp.]
MAGFSETSFAILAELEANNNKAWYDENKEKLKAEVRAPFAGMLGVVTMLLEGSRYPMIGSEKTMFRQYRDVRFSKDKTPYKSTVSGMITPNGSKGEGGGVVYAQVGPRGGMLAAGHYQLATPELNRVRDRIVAEPESFAEMVEALEAKGYPLSREGSLKTMPRGFQQHGDAACAPFLRLKRYVTSVEQPKAVWLNGDIVEKMVHLAEAIGPLNAWVREAMIERAEAP